MSGDLRALAEKYVALNGEIDDVRREMLACLTNGGGANPVRPTSPAARRAAGQRNHPNAIAAAKIDEKVIDLLKATPGMKVNELAKATSSKTSTTSERLRRMRTRQRRLASSQRVALTAEEIADLIAAAPAACAPWWTPLYASTAKDVAQRKPLDDRTRGQKVAAYHENRIRAQATARLNGSGAW